MITLLRAATMLLPWSLRRRLLSAAFGYELHDTSYIGFSWMFPRRLRLGPYARIGHGNVCYGLDDVCLEDHSIIGSFNWITGLSSQDPSPFFVDEHDRIASFRLGRHAAVTSRHFIDCTRRVDVGAYTTIGGVRTALMTHEIDVRTNRQVSRGIQVGEYCYLGTCCTLLPGAVVPARCVVGAGALVRAGLHEEQRLYAGVPARSAGEVPDGSRYFTRSRGFVF